MRVPRRPVVARQLDRTRTAVAQRRRIHQKKAAQAPRTSRPEGPGGHPATSDAASPSVPSSSRTALRPSPAPEGMAAGRNIGISRYPMPKIIIVAQPRTATCACASASASGDHGRLPTTRFAAMSAPAAPARTMLTNASARWSETPRGSRAAGRFDSSRAPTNVRAPSTAREAIPTTANRPVQNPPTMPAVPSQKRTQAIASARLARNGRPSASGATMYTAPRMEPEIQPSVTRCSTAISRGW